MRELYLPASLETLGDRALYNLDYLTDIHIPGTVGSVSGYALGSTDEGLVIWGEKGSAAEGLAMGKGLPFCEEGQPRPRGVHFEDISVYRKSGNVCLTCPQEDVAAIKGILGDQDGVAEILTLSSSLPQRNKALYEMFPELKYVNRNDGYIVMLRLKDYPGPEDILNLFIEQGFGISFYNCILSGEYSYTGRNEPIHSFEDYYSYRGMNWLTQGYQWPPCQRYLGSRQAFLNIL